MILIITEKRNNIVETQTIRTVLKISPFDVTPRAVLKEYFEAAGDLLVGTGAGTYARLAKGANGTWLGVDITSGNLAYAAIEAGGGMTFDMTNGSLSSAPAGTLAILDTSGNNKFTTSAVPYDSRVIAIVTETIASGAEGQLAAGGKYTVLVQGNVAIGQWLVQSATNGRAMAAGYSKPAVGAIGYATTSYSGGGAGSVEAVVNILPTNGASSGFGYFVTGHNGTSAHTTAIKINGVTDTSASIAAVASLARYTTAGISSSLYGWIIGGYTGSAASLVTDKLTFSADTIAASTAQNAPLTVYGADKGASGSDRGYLRGGSVNGAEAAFASKLNYSAGTHAASATSALSEATSYASSLLSTTETLTLGGATGSTPKAIANKCTLSNDVAALVSTANFSTAKQSACGNIYSLVAGYCIGGNAAGAAYSTLADKCLFATLVTSSVATAAPTIGCSSGLGVPLPNKGYAGLGVTAGGNTATVNQVNYSTDTTSVLASAALPFAQSSFAACSVAV